MTDKQKNYPPGTYTGLGIAIGTSMGFMAGMLVFNNPSMGAGVGFVLPILFVLFITNETTKKVGVS